jgi:hypothetical protein
MAREIDCAAGSMPAAFVVRQRNPSPAILIRLADIRMIQGRNCTGFRSLDRDKAIEPSIALFPYFSQAACSIGASIS